MDAQYAQTWGHSILSQYGRLKWLGHGRTGSCTHMRCARGHTQWYTHQPARSSSVTTWMWLEHTAAAGDMEHCSDVQTDCDLCSNPDCSSVVCVLCMYISTCARVRAHTYVHACTRTRTHTHHTGMSGDSKPCINYDWIAWTVALLMQHAAFRGFSTW